MAPMCSPKAAATTARRCVCNLSPQSVRRFSLHSPTGSPSLHSTPPTAGSVAGLGSDVQPALTRGMPSPASTQLTRGSPIPQASTLKPFPKAGPRSTSHVQDLYFNTAHTPARLSKEELSARITALLGDEDDAATTAAGTASGVEPRSADAKATSARAVENRITLLTGVIQHTSLAHHHHHRQQRSSANDTAAHSTPHAAFAGAEQFVHAISLSRICSPRTILSGLARHYAAPELAGRRVVVATNLPIEPDAGILSQGMLLCDRAGRPVMPPEEAQVGDRLVLDTNSDQAASAGGRAGSVTKQAKSLVERLAFDKSGYAVLLDDAIANADTSAFDHGNRNGNDAGSAQVRLRKAGKDD